MTAAGTTEAVTTFVSTDQLGHCANAMWDMHYRERTAMVRRGGVGGGLREGQGECTREGVEGQGGWRGEES